MLQRAVLWQAMLLVVTSSLDVRYYPRKRLYTPVSQVECFDYPEWGPKRYTRASSADWIQHSDPSIPSSIVVSGSVYSPPSFIKSHMFSRRFDLFTSKEDMVKEHAKLVQDINSLKQELFVAPLLDKNRDYDDSLYSEAIETSTTSRPTVPSIISRPKKPSTAVPVVLVGGASQRTVVKSQPLRFMRPTVSLVGTSISPIVKHPYPFVLHPGSAPPIRICMPSPPPIPAVYPKPKPSLLQRLLNGIISG